MRVRFLADANFNLHILRGFQRRCPPAEVVTADEAGLRGVADPQVLKLAAEMGLALVSHDVKTMPAHFRDRDLGRPSPGVLLIQQSAPIAAAIDELELVWEASEAQEWQNQLVWLPL